MSPAGRCQHSACPRHAHDHSPGHCGSCSAAATGRPPAPWAARHPPTRLVKVYFSPVALLVAVVPCSSQPSRSRHVAAISATQITPAAVRCKQVDATPTHLQPAQLSLPPQSRLHACIHHRHRLLVGALTLATRLSTSSPTQLMGRMMTRTRKPTSRNTSTPVEVGSVQ